MKSIVAVFLFLSSSAFATNFWEQTKGPYGGVGGPIFSDSSGTLYVEAGNASGVYLYRSTDQGNHWALVPLSNVSVRSVTVKSDGKLFVGGFDFTNYKYYVYYSTDRGNTWVRSQKIFPAQVKLITGTAKNGHLFAATGSTIYPQDTVLHAQDSVYHSTDNGLTWNVSGFGGYDIASLATDSSGNVYAGGSSQNQVSHVFRTIDDGSSWWKTSFPDSLKIINTIVINSNDHLFVGSENGMYRSTDKGDSWTIVRDSTRGPVKFITVGLEAALYVGIGYGVYSTTNEGSSWEYMSDLPFWAKNYSASLSSMTVIPNGNFFGTGGGGIYRSTNKGVSWIEKDSGLIFTPAQSLVAFNSNGHVFSYTLTNGLFKTTNNGTDWIHIDSFNFSPNNYPTISFAANTVKGILYVGSSSFFYRSTDEGMSWMKIDSGLQQAYGVGSLTVAPNGHVFAMCITGPYSSTDDGISWTKKNVGLPPSYNLFSLAVTKNGYAFFACEYGLYRSSDEGDLWIKDDSAPQLTPTQLFADSSGKIFVDFIGNGGGIYFSSDNGGTWVNTHFNKYYEALAINSKGDIYLSVRDDAPYGSSSIYFSTNAGTSWMHRDSSAIYAGIPSLAFGPSGRLFAGTYYSGVWVSSKSTTSVEGREDVLLTALLLKQNFPNPFSSSTQIHFALPEAGNAKLVVYDLYGREVKRLLEKNMNAGEYEVPFSGEYLPNGIYIYRLSEGKYVETKTMVLTK